MYRDMNNLFPDLSKIIKQNHFKVHTILQRIIKIIRKKRQEYIWKLLYFACKRSEI